MIEALGIPTSRQELVETVTDLIPSAEVQVHHYHHDINIVGYFVTPLIFYFFFISWYLRDGYRVFCFKRCTYNLSDAQTTSFKTPKMSSNLYLGLQIPVCRRICMVLPLALRCQIMKQSTVSLTTKKTYLPSATVHP